MNEQHKYRSTDKMSDLICDNYSLLMEEKNAISHRGKALRKMKEMLKKEL